MTVIYRPEESAQFSRVLTLLQAKEAVAIPSETVYGLAALALDEVALSRIFKLKNRPTFDPLIVHVLDLESAKPLVQKIHPLQERLCRYFWPGPLTILFRKSQLVPDLCTAGTEWVALRSPAHPIFRKVLQELKAPLAAPSANRFGQISPTSSEDVVKELGPYGLSAVLEGGASQFGVESTVIKILEEKNSLLREVEILRPGSVAVEDLAKCVGPEISFKIRESGTGIDPENLAQESPGLLKSHYAPQIPLLAYNALSISDQKRIHEKANLYSYLEVFPDTSMRQVFLNQVKGERRIVLSESGSDLEAASKLFAGLRRLDEQKAKAIIVGALPTQKTGLLPAIFDRLQRAISSNSLPQ
jgi:L-threonylcarbamoyladenylate synthase